VYSSRKRFETRIWVSRRYGKVTQSSINTSQTDEPRYIRCVRITCIHNLAKGPQLANCINSSPRRIVLISISKRKKISPRSHVQYQRRLLLDLPIRLGVKELHMTSRGNVSAYDALLKCRQDTYCSICVVQKVLHDITRFRECLSEYLPQRRHRRVIVRSV
jgi:hypothetical protein